MGHDSLGIVAETTLNNRSLENGEKAVSVKLQC